MNQLEEFKDLYLGKRAIIIGKGPSLDKAGAVRGKLDGSVVLCINESIHKIEAIGVAANLFVVQQDSHLQYLCIPTLPTTVHFMNCRQKMPKDSCPGWWKLRPVEMSPWNPRAVLYEAGQWSCDSSTLTAIIGVQLARHMGCSALAFFGFDSWLPGGSAEYASGMGSKNEDGGPLQRHAASQATILAAAKKCGYENPEIISAS